MKRIIPAVLIAVVVAGCNSSPEKKAKAPRRVVEGTNIPQHAVRTVRDYEIVNTYHLGRRIDPHNPNIMYEAGKMYVIRRSPTWNLRPNTPVGAPGFKSCLRPVNFKNKEIKRQMNLTADDVRRLEQIKNTLINIQKEVKEKNKKNSTLPELNLGKIQEAQGEIKRKIAELE